MNVEYVEAQTSFRWLGVEVGRRAAQSNDPNYTDPNFLILHNVTYEDAGWYGCVASNSLGNSTQKAYLTVLPQSPEAVVRDQRDSKSRYGPLFTANMSDSDVKVEIGSVLYLECPADGFPTPSISWLKDGSDVIKNKDVHFREWSLKIENVVERDEGVYTCVISNSEGVIDFKFSVHVVEGIPRPPVFTKLNKMLPLVAIPAGTTAVLKCPADGYPIPQITWFKNNVFLEKDDRETMPALETFERKALRTIFGPVKDQGCWYTRYNFELYRLFKEPQVTQVIRSNRLRWLGHIWRSPENNRTRAYTFKNPMGSQTRGRPRTRWIDDVENDLKTLNIKN
ncbi:hemicentin-2 [Trichonephila clavipes]|nr:hemicentin-2 [Trichonephila clavipes]